MLYLESDFYVPGKILDQEIENRYASKFRLFMRSTSSCTSIIKTPNIRLTEIVPKFLKEKLNLSSRDLLPALFWDFIKSYTAKQIDETNLAYVKSTLRFTQSLTLLRNTRRLKIWVYLGYCTLYFSFVHVSNRYSVLIATKVKLSRSDPSINRKIKQ